MGSHSRTRQARIRSVPLPLWPSLPPSSIDYQLGKDASSEPGIDQNGLGFGDLPSHLLATQSYPKPCSRTWVFGRVWARDVCQGRKGKNTEQGSEILGSAVESAEFEPPSNGRHSRQLVPHSWLIGFRGFKTLNPKP